MLGGPGLGARIVHVPETGSTNDDLRRLALDGAPEGTVVRADRQTSGRGRAGRAWSSPDGGLWFSVLLRPDAPPALWGFLPLLVGASVAAALRARGFPAAVKWPNDVVDAGGRKVAGVLCESLLPPAPDDATPGWGRAAGGFVVAGVGLNANVALDELPEDVRAVATSLLAHAGPVDLAGLLRDVLAALDARYRAFESGGESELLGEYRSLSATLGRRVTTSAGVEGVAVDVLANGALVVEKDDGARVAVGADEVRVVRRGA